MNIFQQLAQEDRKAFQNVRREFQRECREHGEAFIKIPEDKIKGMAMGGIRPQACFRNRSFFAMLFMDDCDGTPYLRMTVNRCELENDGGWRGDITWDELMDVKRGIGFADLWMTEIYPPDAEIVNVANMRHLFLVNCPPYAWVKNPQKTAKGMRRRNPMLKGVWATIKGMFSRKGGSHE